MGGFFSREVHFTLTAISKYCIVSLLILALSNFIRGFRRIPLKGKTKNEDGRSSA